MGQASEILLALVLATMLAVTCGSDPDKKGTGESWMLNEHEISDARDGIAREGLALFTRHNSAELLPDGQNIMRSLYEDFESTRKGDFIHGVSFDELLEVILLPDPSNPEQNKYTTIGNTLIRAIKRGVNVRILANFNLYYPLQAPKFCHPLNNACEDKMCCIPDGRHNSASGSVHTKLWVIQSRGTTVGYVGGLDICAGRYDTQDHSDSKLRKVQPPLGVRYYGWHDNMYKIRGNAVVDLAKHFWQRWNDPASPAPMYKPTKFEWETPPVDGKPGTLTMQVVRTLSCLAAEENEFYSNFAPRGETTFRSAFLKMVSMAEEYLYMEDQFMFYPEMVEYVAKALPRIKKLIIMTDSAHAWTVNLPAGIKISMATEMRMYYQSRALSQLYANIDGVSYADRVHVFDMVRPGGFEDNPEDLIYVHAKTYLADDKYAILGSAGIERAAFTGDVDVSIGIHDESGPGPDSFVGQLRRRLWAEHLNTTFDDPAITDPISAVDVFNKQAENPEWRLRQYWPNKVSMKKKWYTDFLYEFLEADGRCPKQRVRSPITPEEEVEHIVMTGLEQGVEALMAGPMATLMHQLTAAGGSSEEGK